MASKWYEVRDPVHDFIIFNRLERDVIDSRPMQRLKRIRQLASTHEVYPGATHTRFEHSLGTMEVATRAFETIVRTGGAELKGWMRWDDDDAGRYRQIIRLAALLHDVGHSPFSHAPEQLLPKGVAGHEAMTEQIIRSEHVRPILESAKPFNVEADEVVAVALGPKHKPDVDSSLLLLGEIVAGDFGVDRIDYLVRDALHSGAAAGRFDYQRLLNTLVVVHHPETDAPVLAFDIGGRHAAEGLLLARYFMFLQVYFHRVRRIYDLHLVDFLRAWLPDGRFPADVDSYLSLTDEAVIRGIDEALAQKEDPDIKIVADRLVGRNHFRVAYEMPPEVNALDPEKFARLAEAVDKEFPGETKADESRKEAYTIGTGELYLKDGDTLRDIFEVSELIRALKPMWIGRIYAHRDVRQKVKQFCFEFEKEETNG